MTADKPVKNIHIADMPGWARWFAMDEDGSWWCYEVEPHRHDSGWYENEVGRHRKIKVSLPGAPDWQHSLQKVRKL